MFFEQSVDQDHKVRPNCIKIHIKVGQIATAHEIVDQMHQTPHPEVH